MKCDSCRSGWPLLKFQLCTLLILMLLAAVYFSFVGTRSTQITLLPAQNLPNDLSNVHPWVVDLLCKDQPAVTAAVHERLAASATPATACMIERIKDFVPCRIEFSDGVGYLLCLKRSIGPTPSGDVADQFYLAEPLPEDVLEMRLRYYDESIQALMKEFLSNYAGCGESMEGDFDGQFAWAQDHVVSDIITHEPESLGEWKRAHILYSALNGDLVLVDSYGATAWCVSETGEVLPLFRSFPDFISHYADIRGMLETFDSWTSRRLLGRHPED